MKYWSSDSESWFMQRHNMLKSMSVDMKKTEKAVLRNSTEWRQALGFKRQTNKVVIANMEMAKKYLKKTLESSSFEHTGETNSIGISEEREEGEMSE